jgi:hypothetical protein
MLFFLLLFSWNYLLCSDFRFLSRKSWVIKIARLGRDFHALGDTNISDYHSNSSNVWCMFVKIYFSKQGCFWDTKYNTIIKYLRTSYIHQKYVELNWQIEKYKPNTGQALKIEIIMKFAFVTIQFQNQIAKIKLEFNSFDMLGIII